MKLFLMSIGLLIGSHLLQAQASAPASPEVITEFHWSGEDLEPFVNKWPWTGGQGGTSQDPSIAVEWHGKDPVSQTLRTLGSDIVSRVTSAHYAIVGKLKYSNVSAGSYLEMLSYFAPEKEGEPEGWYYSRTLADAGPMAKLEGTDEGRDFLLPFDATEAKTKLVRLVLNLHLAGPGGVELADVKLIQYPDAASSSAGKTPKATDKIKEIMVKVAVGADQGTSYSVDGIDYASPEAMQQYLTAQHQANSHIAVVIRADKNVPYADIVRVLDAAKNTGIQSVSFAATTDQASQFRSHSGLAEPAPAHPLTVEEVGLITQYNWIDWKSFLLGVAATGVSLLFGGGIVFIFRRLNRRRHERELRRIASLDS